MSDFFKETAVKNPRKAKRCYWCNEECEVGQRRIFSRGLSEGDFFVSYFHPECAIAREAYMSDSPYGEPWPDEGSMQRGLEREKGDETP